MLRVSGLTVLPSTTQPFILPTPLFTMNHLLSFLLLVTAASPRVSAAIGPTALLEISNANLAPDGFSRSFVLFAFIAGCGID